MLGMLRKFRNPRPSPLRLEQSLLSAQIGASDYGPSFFRRCWIVLKAEGEPSWLNSYKSFLLSSYLNILLLFVPLSAAAHYEDWDAGFRFSFSTIAIVPLFKLLGQSTEQISFRLGQIPAGLLNVLFGNPEFIVGVAALLRDELDLVQSAMLGCILYNILLMLGCSFCASGLRYTESNFQVTASQNSGSLITLVSIAFVIPAIYHYIKLDGGGLHVLDYNDHQSPVISCMNDTDVANPALLRGLLIISRGTAVMLLLVYILYLFFELKSHHYLFTAIEDDDLELEPAGMSTISACTAFLVMTIVTFFSADHLVASVGEFTKEYHVPRSLIGLVIIPITMNIVDHIITVWIAMRGHMEPVVGICIGNSINIGTFILPFLVLLGWLSNHQLVLLFGNFETISLHMSVLLVNQIIHDGKSNYLEGFMLITLYSLIVLTLWVFYYK
ncbi:calcium/proton exchanger [Armillaria luteobubalina]|uniref:Vacuolar calcium ion transporter n=1 Tax=Armillaria luteobubalina TaxID=153913 RepID=A0AA39TP58_9AGAR|nr:calcium/proton exchanger [Armillaria luteobubalina]